MFSSERIRQRMTENTVVIVQRMRKRYELSLIILLRVVAIQQGDETSKNK